MATGWAKASRAAGAIKGGRAACMMRIEIVPVRQREIAASLMLRGFVSCRRGVGCVRNTAWNNGCGLLDLDLILHWVESGFAGINMKCKGTASTERETRNICKVETPNGGFKRHVPFSVIVTLPPQRRFYEHLSNEVRLLLCVWNCNQPVALSRCRFPILSLYPIAIPLSAKTCSRIFPLEGL